ncbi:hypothetical protein Vadar_008386 [Vaccinium darrowii]|uniref:Uncharacterized protein n=1 Tax=Vaccinium darrowii TaxID=229202 RepID=A0ACB7YDI3_9ERIC|nr:hypothetical protein Vadar_008386 [Vaccinium darrowii]
MIDCLIVQSCHDSNCLKVDDDLTKYKDIRIEIQNLKWFKNSGNCVGCPPVPGLSDLVDNNNSHSVSRVHRCIMMKGKQKRADGADTFMPEETAASFLVFLISNCTKMASSPLRSKSNYHARSVSLPSRLHPLIPHVDESLRLSGLQNMFDRLDDLLLLPHTQQAFAQQRHEIWVEEVLEKYLGLLDICSAAKDVSIQTKQDVQSLLSVFRRRRDTNDFSAYLTSRKKAKKVIQKSLKDLKSIKSKSTKIAFDKNHEIFEIVSLLNEVEAATIMVFESLLSYIAGSKMESRGSVFSLVSKLTNRKKVSSKEEETNTNPFQEIDASLHSLNSHKTSETDGVIHMEIVQNQISASSEATSSSLPSISNTLHSLENLYDFVDDLLLLPQTRKSLGRQCNGKFFEEALDGYLRLLDTCAATKDIISQTKEDVKEQLSNLRRKRDATDFGGYLNSRKKVKKAIQKLLNYSKRIVNKGMLLNLAMDKDHETVATFSMLKEVEAVTVSALESLLCYASGTKVQSRESGWCLVSKLMHHKKAACQMKETIVGEFEKIDAAIHVLIGRQPTKSDNKNIETVQNQLGELELSVQGLEEVLERLLRRLIRTRVSLLNILNH